MRLAGVLGLLLSAFWLYAQTPPPAPELDLDVNAQSDASVSNGWPLLIRVLVMSADGQPLSIGLKSGPWTDALHLTVTDNSGISQAWPAQLVPPTSTSLALSGLDTAEAVWLVAPADSAVILPGAYNLTVTLDTTTTAADGSWSGASTSSGVSVTLAAEPASLSPDDEASKYLAFAAYSRLKGDAQGTGSALDTLIAHQPTILEAYSEKGDLLASQGDYSGALALYQQTLASFVAANPNADEPMTLLTRPVDAMVAKIINQQEATTLTTTAPGRTESVFAPDSIVDAYGIGLATGTESASDSLSTSLNGTTVTITDSSGVSTPASLFYVSSSLVDFAAPASLALGAATVTVKAGDGTVRTGSVVVANVEPAVFTLNAAGLAAASILRITDSGQVYQNVYTVDAGNNIVAAPIDVSKDQVYLVLYATGIRRAAQSQVTITVGGMNLPAQYAGPQGSYTGLDQVNVLLPPSLAGRGDVPLILSAAGTESNLARLTFK
jgi:uncharacterized protein (TIGR03437 family)